MSVDRGRAVEQAYYLSRANKNAQSAKDIMTLTNGLIDFAGTAASAGAMMYNPNTANPTSGTRVPMSDISMDKNFTVKSNSTLGPTTPYKPMNVKL